jgi:hypothetical protein
LVAPIESPAPIMAITSLRFQIVARSGLRAIGIAHLFQPRTFDLRAAEFVGENALAPCFLERVPLHFQILVMARHSGVSDPQGLKFSLRHQILDTRIKNEGFEDPAAFQGTEQERLALFRRVRDEIRDYLKTFPS